MSQQMHDAVWNGDVAMIESLIAEGEDPNVIDQQSGWSGLMLAAENGQAESMMQLLGRGADAKYAMSDGWTALHHAVDSECDAEAQTGQPADGRLVKLLIAAGADPNAVWMSSTGSATPRSLAARYRCQIVQSSLDG